MVAKLDYISRRGWESETNKNLSPNIEEFLVFLKNRCQFLEFRFDKLNNTNNHNKTEHKLRVHLSTKNTNQCLFCNDSHTVYFCRDFNNLSVQARLNGVRKRHAYTNCLRLGHSSQNCTAGSCRKCGKRHNTLLHFEYKQNTSSSNTNNQIHAQGSISSVMRTTENIPHS